MGQVPDIDVIDLRPLMPAQRHAKIFERVTALPLVASSVLLTAPAPKPLYSQPDAEYPGQFSWTYLEPGPEAGRVEIGRLAKAA